MLTQLMQRGQIERLEFEYERYCTGNPLAGLTVYNGWMWAECLDNDGDEHFWPNSLRGLGKVPSDRD